MSQPFALAELLEHAGWLRGLARRLVRDATQADDLVQDTWLAALRRPPPPGTPVKPWLARVLRNFLANSRRNEAHRRDRDQALSVEAPRSSPPPDSGLSVAEAQRTLAEAVARLEEPLREAIVLRYYHELSAAEMARRLEVPAGTVRWRLSKARESLRDDLAGRAGPDRVAWVLGLAPLVRVPATPVGSANLPVLAKAAGALFLAAVGVLASRWMPSSLSNEARSTPAGPGSSARVAPIPGPLHSPGALEARVEAIDPDHAGVQGSESPRAPSRAAEGSVSGVVLVVDGRSPLPVVLDLYGAGEQGPIRAVRATLEQARRRASVPDARSIEVAADGAFEVSGLESGQRGRLRARGYVLEDGNDSLEFLAPARGLVLRLVHRAGISGRLVDEDGRGLPNAAGLLRYEVAPQKGPDEAGAESAFLPVQTDESGAFQVFFEDPSDEDEGLAWLCFELDDAYAAIVERPFDPRAGLEIGDLLACPARSLRLHVVDAHGGDVRGAVARVDTGIVMSRATGPTDPNGRTDLVFAPRGPFRLRVDALGHETAFLDVGGDLDDLEVPLRPASGLVVRWGGEPETREGARWLVRAPAELFSARPAAGLRSDFLEGWLRSRLGASEPVPHPESREGPQTVRVYAPDGEGRLLLFGLRPGIPFLIETRARDGRTVDVRSVVVRDGAREEIEMAF